MSIVHTSVDCRGQAPTPAFGRSVVRTSIRVLDSGRSLTISAALAVRHRADMQRISRFSDHTLQDIGFERDWDGTVILRQQ